MTVRPPSAAARFIFPMLARASHALGIWTPVLDESNRVVPAPGQSASTPYPCLHMPSPIMVGCNSLRIARNSWPALFPKASLLARLSASSLGTVLAIRHIRSRLLQASQTFPEAYAATRDWRFSRTCTTVSGSKSAEPGLCSLMACNCAGSCSYSGARFPQSRWSCAAARSACKVARVFQADAPKPIAAPPTPKTLPGLSGLSHSWSHRNRGKPACAWPVRTLPEEVRQGPSSQFMEPQARPAEQRCMSRFALRMRGPSLISGV